MLTRNAFYKTVLTSFTLLLAATLFFACAPSDNGGKGALSDKLHTETLSIYRCDDVYITNDTFSRGLGTISLPILDSGYEISDCKLLLCDDGCDPAAVVSRAAQGYAPAYYVVENGEFVGNYLTVRFNMELPEEVVESLKIQGVYEEFMAEHERNFYYLLTLDDTHYAYIHITAMEDTEKPDNESLVVDGIVKDAVITLDIDAA